MKQQEIRKAEEAKSKEAEFQAQAQYYAKVNPSVWEQDSNLLETATRSRKMGRTEKKPKRNGGAKCRIEAIRR